MADTPDLPNQAQADQDHISALKDQQAELDKQSATMKDIFGSTKAQADSLQKILDSGKIITALEEKRLLNAIKVTNGSENAVKTAKLYQTAQRATLEGLQAQGKYMKAFLQDSKDAVMYQGKFHLGKALGEGAKGVENIEQNVYAALDPWGLLLKMIVDIVDGIRMTRSELQKASAPTGEFVKGLEAANEQSININQHVAGFMTQYGMAKDEVVELEKALKGTGFRDFGANIVDSDGNIKQFAIDAQAMAKAGGIGIDALAGRYEDLRRSILGTGASQEKVTQTYFTMFKQATLMAEKGIMKFDEYISTVMSLADAFRDVGMSIESVEQVTQSTARAMMNLHFPMADVSKIAQQLMGATKSASEGWQVLIGKMNGMGGGYAQTLFGMQQRGAGMKMPGQNEFNGKQFIDQMGKTILKMTAGIGDMATKQLMTEKIGGQMGLDAKTVEVLQELQSGGMSAEEAGVKMDQVHEAMKKNNLDSKGMFEILKTILVGLIAKPIVMIYDVVRRWSGSKADPGMANVRKNLSKIESGANGLELTTGGLVMGHAKEAMVNGRLVPVAATRPLNRDNMGGGNGSNTFTFNMNIDEQNLKQQFRKMENKTITLLKKQQAANFH